MIFDLQYGAPAQAAEISDVIVVGAGAVGLTLAVALARRGLSVTVLEAGGEKLDGASQQIFSAAEWGAMPLPGLHVGRFRTLGGTTNFWGGQLVRFDPIVFKERPWVCDVGWPIGREALNPYYDEAARLLGIEKILSDDELWSAIDVSPPEMGDDVEMFFSAWAPQPNFVALFSDDIKKLSNLHVYVNAPAVGLVISPERNEITSVRVRALDGAVTDFSGKFIALANGTVEIARLLKIPTSSAGRPAPWIHNPWLGRGYMDHVDCYAGEVHPLRKKQFHNLFDNAYIGGVKYTPKLKFSEAAQLREQRLGIAAHFLFRSSVEHHIANLKNAVRTILRDGMRANGLSWRSLRSAGALAGVLLPMASRYLRSHRMYNPADAGIVLRLTSEQSVDVESSLSLLERVDSTGLPVVRVDWRVPSDCLTTMSEFAVAVRNVLARNEIADLNLNDSLLSRSSAFLNQCDDANHHMGMARMATQEHQGVVDPDQRVFGTRNLFVAGAAVFPTSGFANPTLTAIALGIRLADHLVAKCK